METPGSSTSPRRITSALDRNDIVIVAGFQGVAQDTKDVTIHAAPPTPPRSRCSLTGRRSLRDLYRRRRSLPPIRESCRALAAFPRSAMRK